MNKLRALLIGGLVLMTSGCSTLSEVHWSKMAPWNWFGSSISVSDNGVGGISAATPLNEEALADGLNGDYRLRSGMRMTNGRVMSYYEALKDDKVALIISGDGGQVGKIEVMDEDIATADGDVKPGTPFSDLYSKAYGACTKGSGDDAELVVCKAPNSQHLSYLFGGTWRGPEGLMPSDDTLKEWTLKKIVWQR
ncbi:RpoE-regulated lipoprotein [Enterobacteriaceae bacterium BIT-l23]|uniref:RpoE-regulated lipoprotein n=1 Tax=Jejubacter calystegiae TaxID=2579935 RepID=A0A4P8YR16_9ENTR|nr:RpoE-regulated lipoprotein [Jejubacter calystegiae]NUU68634.1 RpoE-regulated lipoprotein [Enterobacteriaceae bacterium BIT-l23]QCT22304.1 RpoE-regulated lipoprotein [Jejubacter calystegiae]